MRFSDCRSNMLGMAHFSTFSDSTSSLFVCVRIRFEPCNNVNHYLAAFVLPGAAICFCGRMSCFLSRLFVF